MVVLESPTVAVEKATSDDSPIDWTIIIGICNSFNSNHEQAEEEVKAVKERLQHKNPNVQLFYLTLLDTMVYNCGDSVHFQIVEKKILDTMIEIVQKKEDALVGEKILALLYSWQKDFGGKNPHYYDAYEKLVAVEKEAMANLVKFCLSSQIKLVQEFTTTGGPELKTSLLSLRAQYDAIATVASGASGAFGASGARVFVVGPQYCVPFPVELKISREAQSTSDFVVRDVEGKFIFRVNRGEDTMPGGILFNEAGKPVVLFEKQFPTFHGTWVVYKGKSASGSKAIFSVKRPEMTGPKTKLVVFLAVNEKRKVFDFKMEESQSENSSVICSGESSTKVAEMMVTEGVSTSEDTILVKIHANIDIAFIVTLAVIHECIEEIGEKRQERYRHAGRVAGRVVAAAGTQLLCGALQNFVLE